MNQLNSNPVGPDEMHRIHTQIVLLWIVLSIIAIPCFIYAAGIVL